MDSDVRVRHHEVAAVRGPRCKRLATPRAFAIQVYDGIGTASMFLDLHWDENRRKCLWLHFASQDVKSSMEFAELS
jgi:hypothetical protein